MRTNLAGLKTIEKILTRAQSMSKAHSPKDAKAYFMFGSLGKMLKIFWSRVYG